MKNLSIPVIIGTKFLTSLSRWLHKQVTLYTVGTCKDFYNGQFIQVTPLCNDLIRQVSLYDSHYVYQLGNFNEM